MKLLLLYTTNEHQTEKIMRRVAEQLGNQAQCDLVQLQPDSQINLADYQGVILGSSIRYGYYSNVMKQFIDNHYKQLNNMMSGFFGVNLVARKAHKNTPETNLYTRKFLSKIQWQPKIKAVFAGALYYPKYNWFDRNMIRFIMWLGKGDTDVHKPFIEYTDWQKVDEFAQQVIKQFNQT
ncbi:menaquinone-dependent protoporphyrinogen oxidase [Orbus hercynius]|uniref:Protoporphyrinogen IX dehydrogenase [quinone] n=1 Tax=Orbus hercynius TaxID=593135 RepID=A0A495RB86_9GAMM|nr:menaquinone-dependent protoporphyrinogen IX dehydrogenase [Orbus hercynius]RKS84434.1 menaquinone-dependent protoporphyrinogen oxidase [Orbus hercynius]